MSRGNLFYSLVLVTICSTLALSQTAPLGLQPEFEFRIKGTSNVRKWGAEVKQIDLDVVLAGFTGKMSDLSTQMFERVHLSIPVAEISSGIPGLSGKIQKHLKKKEHPTITFDLLQVDRVESQGIATHITMTGTLNVAGAERMITLEGIAHQGDSGVITFTGQKGLLMTDFGIKPPTAMFGTMRAKDPVEILFSLQLGAVH